MLYRVCGRFLRDAIEMRGRNFVERCIEPDAPPVLAAQAVHAAALGCEVFERCGQAAAFQVYGCQAASEGARALDGPRQNFARAPDLPDELRSAALGRGLDALEHQAEPGELLAQAVMQVTAN